MYFLRGDLADDADAETRSGKRMAANQRGADAQPAADPADLVLEQEAQRLHNLEIHLLREASDIVVGLDYDSRAVHLCGLYHVGVNRALSEPFHVLDFSGGRVEYLDEVLADNLPLCFRVSDSAQISEKPFRCLNPSDIQSHTLVGLKHFRSLVLSHQAGIHEDAVEVVADGAVQEHCRD